VASDLRDKLRGDVQVAAASELLPHHRRGGLLVLRAETDLLDVAFAIASDDLDEVAGYIDGGQIFRPSLAQLADWCVDSVIRFQVVILQPYVLAQPIIAPNPGLN
jgi:hypothetical protein